MANAPHPHSPDLGSIHCLAPSPTRLCPLRAVNPKAGPGDRKTSTVDPPEPPGADPPEKQPVDPPEKQPVLNQTLPRRREPAAQRRPAKPVIPGTRRGRFVDRSVPPLERASTPPPVPQPPPERPLSPSAANQKMSANQTMQTNQKMQTNQTVLAIQTVLANQTVLAAKSEQAAALPLARQNRPPKPSNPATPSNWASVASRSQPVPLLSVPSVEPRSNHPRLATTAMNPLEIHRAGEAQNPYPSMARPQPSTTTVNLASPPPDSVAQPNPWLMAGP